MSLDRHDFDQTEVDQRFRVLARLLAEHPLPTQNGSTRLVDAHEFMLMHVRAVPDVGGEVTGFKHRLTRNYVFVNTLFRPPLTEHVLYVPAQRDALFMAGFFDGGSRLFARACGDCGRIDGDSIMGGRPPEEDPRCD